MTPQKRNQMHTYTTHTHCTTYVCWLILYCKKCYLTYTRGNTREHFATYVSCIRSERDRRVLHTGHGSDAWATILYLKKCYVTYIMDNTHAHCTTYVSCLRAERDLRVLHTGHAMIPPYGYVCVRVCETPENNCIPYICINMKPWNPFLSSVYIWIYIPCTYHTTKLGT